MPWVPRTPGSRALIWSSKPVETEKALSCVQSQEEYKTIFPQTEWKEKKHIQRVRALLREGKMPPAEDLAMIVLRVATRMVEGENPQAQAIGAGLIERLLALNVKQQQLSDRRYFMEIKLQAQKALDAQRLLRHEERLAQKKAENRVIVPVRPGHGDPPMSRPRPTGQFGPPHPPAQAAS